MSSFRTFISDFFILISAGWSILFNLYYNSWDKWNIFIPFLTPLIILFTILDIRKLQRGEQ